MIEPDADELRRVLAQVASMRQNLPKQPSEHDAARFHEQLDRLDRAGYDVTEFRIDPDQDRYRRVMNSGPRGTTYYKTWLVRPGVQESKIDAILTYFRLISDQEPIGFAAPRKAAAAR